MFKRLLESSRYLVVFGVVSTLAASAGAFLWGTWKTGLLLWNLALSGGDQPHLAVRLIELMDKFLIATGLYIFAVGLYDLFLGELDLPKWMDVHSLHDIKSRITSILVLFMAIVFVEHLAEWEKPMETLALGAAISVVTLALLVFNRYSEKAQ
ncbi:MAG: putative rane protein YqhA [Holophagaceae bacterium]|nr:putative rane protein YqhA [Holophagaceae bacterium]